MAIVPEDGIVAIPRGNSDEILITPPQRALPPSIEESMALALESPPSPHRMFFFMSFHRLFINRKKTVFCLCLLFFFSCILSKIVLIFTKTYLIS